MPRRPGVSPEISTPVIGRPVSRTERTESSTTGDTVGTSSLIVRPMCSSTESPLKLASSRFTRTKRRSGPWSASPTGADSKIVSSSARDSSRSRSAARIGPRSSNTTMPTSRPVAVGDDLARDEEREEPVREPPLQARAAQLLAARDAHAGQVGVRQRLPGAVGRRPAGHALVDRPAREAAARQLVRRAVRERDQPRAGLDEHDRRRQLLEDGLEMLATDRRLRQDGRPRSGPRGTCRGA